MTTQVQHSAPRTIPGRSLWFGLLLLLIGYTGCVSSSMLRDPAAIQKTTALKDKALNLMAKGTEAYATHKTAAQNLLAEANALYAQQKKRENNNLSVQQWKLLLEDNATTGTSGILTGFFTEWENAEAPLSTFFVNEKKKKVAEAFDEILKLEQAKPVTK